MLDIFMSIWNFLSGLWNVLPDSKKDEIKEKMAAAMEEKFRRYYADAKEKAGAV